MSLFIFPRLPLKQGIKAGPVHIFWLQFPSGHCLKARYLNLLVKCYWMQLNEVSSHPEVLWTHKNLNLAQNIWFLCIFFSNSAYLHFAQIYSAKPLSTDFQRGQLFNLYTMQKFKLNQFGRYFLSEILAFPKKLVDNRLRISFHIFVSHHYIHTS